jgi:aldehyde dehydrogenase (NAD+)
MYSYQHFFINGQWQEPSKRHVDGDDSEIINVINPANGQIIATTPAASHEDIDNAIAAANSAFPSWSATSAKQRTQWIILIADEMQNRSDDLTKSISATMGSPIHIAKQGQVQDSIDAFREFADMTSFVETSKQTQNVMQYHVPIGVCVLINPWNYPLSQLVGKLGPALATGCTVVVKPSEQTPIQDLIMAEIFEKVGVPAGVFNVITGVGSQIGSHLCSHPDVDMVSFTGSTAAGIKVAEAAAPTVKRVCQELGGKSPYIITQNADLETAVRYGVEDVMYNSGQTCSALTRMIIHEDKYQQAIQIAKAVAEQNKVGDPNSPETTIGPLSSKLQQQRVLDFINKAIEEGATLVTGGIELPSDLPEKLKAGAFVAPTIFADVSNEMTIAQEEIFGPVLCMIPYKTEQEAIAIANDTIYGLAAAVYDTDSQSALRIARKIKAGQCYVQGAYFNTLASFGGFKQSGNGREWGVEGLREFVEVQAIIIDK